MTDANLPAGTSVWTDVQTCARLEAATAVTPGGKYYVIAAAIVDTRHGVAPAWARSMSMTSVYEVPSSVSVRNCAHVGAAAV